MRKMRSGLALVGACALGLLVAGLVVIATADPVAFGWFAYAPVPAAVTVPRLLWTPQQLLGAALVLVGLLAGAGAAGYALGRRAGRSRR